MWKKNEETASGSTSSPPPARSSSSTPPRSGERAVIGPSISIHGDVTGEEDLLIQGKVEGKVDLQQNNVTIGEHGDVEADLFGRSLVIEGKVEGNLVGEERVVVRASGTVIGNITSPRVHLEDGATFKGTIDMDSKSGRRSSPSPKKPQRGPGGSAGSGGSGSSSETSKPAKAAGTGGEGG